MDFLSVCLAVVLWFIRPQDIIPGLAGLTLVRYVMFAALMSMLNRPGGWSLKEVFRTPLDWLMYAYLGYIIWQSNDHYGTAKEVFSLAAFYTCTALALTTKERFRTYLKIWLGCITVVALLALSSYFGIEVVQGSSSLTNSFGGRLSLNSWIFNNPNSLGHTAVVVFPLAYGLLWRNGSSASKLTAALCWTIAGSCALLTQSKGSFLAGGAATCVVFLFDKSLSAKLVIIVTLLTVGVSAIKLLPRMETLNKHEEGIAARLLFWQQAWVKMEETGTGVGWKVFRAKLENRVRLKNRRILVTYIERPAHGSYVTVGADLGYPGLFLYVGVLFCGMRCLWQARCGPGSQWEQIQSALLATLTCYVTSAWVIDRAYHTDYFLIAGAIAAFHRMALRDRPDEVEAERRDYVSAGIPALVPATPGLSYSVAELMPWMQARMDSISHSTGRGGSGTIEENSNAPDVLLRWQHLGWLDLAGIFLLFRAVLYIWDYVSRDFITL